MKVYVLQEDDNVAGVFSSESDADRWYRGKADRWYDGIELNTIKPPKLDSILRCKDCEHTNACTDKQLAFNDEQACSGFSKMKTIRPLDKACNNFDKR